MGQTRFTVADQTLCLCYDGNSGQGILVRLDDGLEVRFSSLECLPHLLEGVVGHRAWQAQHEQIVAKIAAALPCA